MHRLNVTLRHLNSDGDKTSSSNSNGNNSCRSKTNGNIINNRCNNTCNGQGRLQDKVCIITGTASGIGRQTALLFAREGARAVICVDVNSKANTETVEMILKNGGKAVVYEADISDEQTNERLIQDCVRDYGRVDVFFANAGIIGTLSSFQSTSAQQFLNTLNINVVGTFLGIKYASKHMCKQDGGGSIICTASVAGMRSGAGGSDYSASKAAIINLVACTANELVRTNVRVNAICPGLVETGMTQALFDAARSRNKESKIGQLNAMGRAGTCDEVAKTALFLACGDSSYITGQSLAVCGGLTSSLPVVSRVVRNL